MCTSMVRRSSAIRLILMPAPRNGGYQLTNLCSRLRFLVRATDAVSVFGMLKFSLAPETSASVPLLHLERRVDGIGMVHVNDAPLAFLSLEEGGAAGIDGALRQFDFEIVFQPDRVPDEMVGARRDHQLRRRLPVEVIVAVVLHGGVASVVVAGEGEDNNLPIETVGEGGFIGAVESLLTGLELLV